MNSSAKKLKMTSSRMNLYFFSAVLIICSCYAASEDKDIRKEYLNFKGEVISYDDERHPQRKCQDALGPDGIWALGKDRCSKKVICEIDGGSPYGFAIQLDDIPETGVICGFIWDNWTRDYFACIEGECTFLQYEDEERR